MKALTRQQSREVDRIAIERYGFSGLVLMENAGRGATDVLLQQDVELLNSGDQRVVILCGKGNNAGDGFVIARHLELRGVRVLVVLLAAADEISGDAKSNLDILSRIHTPILDLSAAEDLANALDSQTGNSRWIVDAMLGTGAQGEPREPVATAIRWMNEQPAQRLAIDVPSGLDCDTGQAASTTVRADHTCTFVAPKRGFLKPESQEYLGTIHIVSIGVPAQILSGLPLS